MAKKCFRRTRKDGSTFVVTYRVDCHRGLKALCLTQQEYNLIQLLLLGTAETDFPADWVDQDDGTMYSLYDCYADGDLLIATYRQVS